MAFPSMSRLLTPVLFQACLLFAGEASRTPEDAGPSGKAGGRAESGLVELGSGRSFARFAAIGAGGEDSQGQDRVCARVKSWAPDFIIALGGDGHPEGGAPAAALDRSVGKYWSEFIHPYQGRYGKGASRNRFFPSLGDQDWRAPGAAPYLDYFGLPGNERYYEFARGPVHLFSLDSHPDEPDGIGRDSRQAQWLRKALAASAAPWKIVYFHHAPYSSGARGSAKAMRWPFREWGADAVMSGHGRHYERLEVDGLAFFVKGTGGKGAAPAADPLPGSRCVFAEDDGAILVEAARDRIDFRFVTAEGVVVDTHTLRKSVLAGSPSAGSARPEEARTRNHLPVRATAASP